MSLTGEQLIMHKNKLVVSVKANGKILREFDEKVLIPFGSHFSLFIKNLNNKRASLKISIDDKDILEGRELVIAPAQTLEIDRELAHFNEGAQLQFVCPEDEDECTNICEGLVRVEFAYEKSASSLDRRAADRRISRLPGVSKQVIEMIGNRQFTIIPIITTEESSVIVFKLVGQVEYELVKQPITVKNKPICASCGRTNKPTSNFCTSCGTPLELL